MIDHPKHLTNAPLKASDSIDLTGLVPNSSTGAELEKSDDDYAIIDGQRWFKISNSHRMPPFFMSGISSDDHWMFISSCGALTAGRQNSDSSLFPYYSSDKILDMAHCTGPRTIIHIHQQTNGATEPPVTRWEPFSSAACQGESRSQNLYKNLLGNRILFEEIDQTHKLAFRYSWTFGQRFGFIRSCELINFGDQARSIDLLDGFENLLPSGLGNEFQLRFSNLADAYKRTQCIAGTNIGLSYLSSIPSDRAEPSEGLRSTVTWTHGLPDPTIALSSEQLHSFRQGHTLKHETAARGKRSAYLAASSFDISPEASQTWVIVADVNYDHCDVAALNQTLRDGENIPKVIQEDVEQTEAQLLSIVSASDGRQMGADQRRNNRHQSNVLFNVMRGGIPTNGYDVLSSDFINQVKTANRPIHDHFEAELNKLPATLPKDELSSMVASLGNVDLDRIASEYMPLRFSRRHGDPTRPWNHFSIDLYLESGEPNLSYQGNWRDIFQNWEALSASYPNFAVNMVLRFVNATTADGYNPYRITKDGFDWEVPEPENPWSNIGYWGDHQIVYLLRLLERALAMTPADLTPYLTEPKCVFADIPYRIRPYEEICRDPQNTIDFDEQSAKDIDQRVKRVGTDGKLLHDANGQITHATLIEKLLVPAFTKLTNFVPGGGIWLNTQRPEWNDANNALVGNGLSVVTTCYLRKYLSFVTDWLQRESSSLPHSVELSPALATLLADIDAALLQHQAVWNASSMTDQQRKQILNSFANAGTSYRGSVYHEPMGADRTAVALTSLIETLKTATQMVDQTIRENRRDDGLYHSYNVLHLGADTAKIDHLYEMLEGQVAVINSGLLSSSEIADLLDSLRASKMYRADQDSYLLYPDRELPAFTEKNQVSASAANQCELLQRLLKNEDKTVMLGDAEGMLHFNGDFRNAYDLDDALNRLKDDDRYCDLVNTESRQAIHALWEDTFEHRHFTGRSGTFFGYEGLGSIYWHMVSKLSLAVIEQCVAENERGVESDAPAVDRLMAHYREIRGGLGIHKSPSEYGAFPQDPYSHTPEGRGAQQPGMTGQVKEDILSRWHELGIQVANGTVKFHPVFFEASEFLDESKAFEHIGINGKLHRSTVPANGFAFTYCQTLIVYQRGKSPSLTLHLANGETVTRSEPSLSAIETQSLFSRSGEINKIEVQIAEA